MITKSDIRYAEHDACFLDIHMPETEDYDVFLYFHGGGLVNGSKEDIRFHEALVSKNICVVSANYRMYPNAKFPDFVVDAADAVAFVQKQFPGKRLFVGGSSAGGYLSMMLCFDERYLENAGVNPKSIAGYIHDAGQPTTHFNVLTERGLNRYRLVIDEAAPAYFVGLKESHPDMLIIVSDDDLPCRLEQTYMFTKALSQFNIGYELKLMHSSHCKYVNKQDENGNFIFADLIHRFISK
ncbi:MAG: alpha/beta hydrolase [Clostridia bacterium]|nr:alpha/beta hydrolase [Clostridia bacterium]